MKVRGMRLILAAMLAMWMGCNGNSSDSSVSRTASQQGTSSGLADYDGDGIDDIFVGAPYA